VTGDQGEEYYYICEPDAQLAWLTAISDRIEAGSASTETRLLDAPAAGVVRYSAAL
jgi:hypothetical protein